MRFDTATLTSAHGRTTNEDCLAYLTENNWAFWAVADGLGGHIGGQTAARLAVSQIVANFEKGLDFSPHGLVHSLQKANDAIINRQRQQPELAGMGTTIVVLATHRNAFLWAYAGDSRLYHFRQGRILYQTKDHSVPQALASAGKISQDQIRFHEDRNRLRRALGQEGDCQPTVSPEEQSLCEGDVFLLCTDGFWEYVMESEMQMELQRSACAETWLKSMELHLIQRAKKMPRFQPDNYTAIGVFVLKN